jgi:transposase-like protein
MTRKKYTSKFKFEIVLQTIKTDSVTEISRKYGINPTLIAKWKSQFMQNGYMAFQKDEDAKMTELQNKVSKLEQIIGKKEVELSLVKNFLDISPNMS